MEQRIGYVLFVLLIFASLLLTPYQTIATPNNIVPQAYEDFFSMPLKPNEIGFMCLGVHSNVIVRVSNKTILFDPSILSREDLTSLKSKKLDLVVYTHDHGDHFDKKTTLHLFQDSQPHVAIAPSLASALKDEIPEEKLIVTESGESNSIGVISIDTLKGKHIGPIMLFRVRVNDIKLLHTGDSSYVSLETMGSDIVFVPTGNPSPTCSPKKAFKMVADVKPQIADAFHGEDREHNKFNKLVDKKLSDINVVIPKPYVPQKLSVH